MLCNSLCSIIKSTTTVCWVVAESSFHQQVLFRSSLRCPAVAAALSDVQTND